MPSNGETQPNKKDNPHQYEQYPRSGPNPDKARKVGEKAVQGAQKDKGKK